METKKCRQCSVVKNLTDFYKDPRGRQGVKGTCKDCANQKRRQFFVDNPIEHQKEKERQRSYRESVKQKVFDHYGAQCACCGETERTFLTLDHINNDGAEHRRSLNTASNARQSSADKVWRDVIKSGFPTDFQILCYNCNCGKRDNGGTCPHQEAKEQDAK